MSDHIQFNFPELNEAFIIETQVGRGTYSAVYKGIRRDSSDSGKLIAFKRFNEHTTTEQAVNEAKLLQFLTERYSF